MRYFTFEQFSHSDTAKRKNIDNSIPSNLRPNTEELINNILDPLREAWGSNIILTSGYRGYELNKAIGGSTTSAHSYGYGADLVPSNGKIEEFKSFVMKWLYDNNIMFDQYINEYSNRSSWVHIGIRNGNGSQRKQYMLYRDNKYTKINPLTFRGISDVAGGDGPSIVYEGATQTGSTDGLLTGKSPYMNDVNIVAIKANDVFQKDENGEPIVDANGNFIITDNYLFEANESVSDGIEDISEIPLEPDPALDLFFKAIENENVEIVKGIAFNTDGSYAVKQSKTLAQIIVMVQEWWEIIQSLKRGSLRLKDAHVNGYEETDDDGEATLTINAMVYMQKAFDMYGHAFREGMTCPICGKKARYLPPGGYCSLPCLLKDIKDKSLSFLMAPNDKYKEFTDIINMICKLLDQTMLLLNAVVLIPDIIKELAALPDEYKQYVQNKIAEGFAELSKLIQEAMVKKNEYLTKILKPINMGVIAKPIAMMMVVVQQVQMALDIAQQAFDMAFAVAKQALDMLGKSIPGFVLPAESFAWTLSPRSFLSPMPYACPDAMKIFVTLPGGSGVPIEALKPTCPSGLQNINIEAIDAIIQSMFPPITPLDYYLEPELFQVRYLFSDQSDLVTQIRQQLEDFLKGGPDYIPKFENLLPIKKTTFIVPIVGTELELYLPNIGYLWFLMGLLDAWAPHSQALVGSIFNPAV